LRLWSGASRQNSICDSRFLITTKVMAIAPGSFQGRCMFFWFQGSMARRWFEDEHSISTCCFWSPRPAFWPWTSPWGSPCRVWVAWQTNAASAWIAPSDGGRGSGTAAATGGTEAAWKKLEFWAFWSFLNVVTVFKRFCTFPADFGRQGHPFPRGLSIQTCHYSPRVLMTCCIVEVQP